MQSPQKQPVVTTLVTASRSHRIEYLQGDRQILVVHLGQHGRSSVSRPPMSHRFADS